MCLLRLVEEFVQRHGPRNRRGSRWWLLSRMLNVIIAGLIYDFLFTKHTWFRGALRITKDVVRPFEYPHACLSLQESTRLSGSVWLLLTGSTANTQRRC